jgi:hypothetical protein
VLECCGRLALRPCQVLDLLGELCHLRAGIRDDPRRFEPRVNQDLLGLVACTGLIFFENRVGLPREVGQLLLVFAPLSDQPVERPRVRTG